MTTAATTQNPTRGLGAATAEGDVEAGARCRLEARINKAKASTSFCLAVTRPVFASSSTSILTILLRRESLIWIQCVIGLATSGTFGYEA